MSIPRFDLVDAEFFAAVGGEIFQINFARAGSPGWVCDEVAKRIGRYSYALARLSGEMHMGSEVRAKDEARAKRSGQCHRRGLQEKASSCAAQQNGHSLPELNQIRLRAATWDLPKTYSGDALGELEQLPDSSRD